MKGSIFLAIPITFLVTTAEARCIASVWHHPRDSSGYWECVHSHRPRPQPPQIVNNNPITVQPSPAKVIIVEIPRKHWWEKLHWKHKQ